VAADKAVQHGPGAGAARRPQDRSVFETWMYPKCFPDRWVRRGSCPSRWAAPETGRPTRTVQRLLTTYRNCHATIFVAPEIARPIEAIHQQWDPLMANQIDAHITLAYPQEAPLVDLLVARVRAASRQTSPFRLRLGALAYFERPEDGVYIEVQDVDGDYRRLRERVLCPPFQLIAFPPHVTLVPPRTSRTVVTFGTTVTTNHTMRNLSWWKSPSRRSMARSGPSLNDWRCGEKGSASTGLLARAAVVSWRPARARRLATANRRGTRRRL
jgi:2'-5' RNA ligase superfamily